MASLVDPNTSSSSIARHIYMRPAPACDVPPPPLLHATVTGSSLGHPHCPARIKSRLEGRDATSRGSCPASAEQCSHENSASVTNVRVCGPRRWLSGERSAQGKASGHRRSSGRSQQHIKLQLRRPVRTISLAAPCWVVNPCCRGSRAACRDGCAASKL